MVVVASGARDGVVKVHRVEEDGKRLACLFVSEEVRSNPGVSVNPRPVSCIQISGEFMNVWRLFEYATLFCVSVCVKQ